MKKIKQVKLSANDNIAPKKMGWINPVLWALIIAIFLAAVYFLALPSSWFRFAAT
tara:strand:+ start:20969 stop:21133 length:165 start_codon:yes stop_codon:yes gene_type:complete